jgi:hypothetical protein
VDVSDRHLLEVLHACLTAHDDHIAQEPEPLP